MTRAKFRLESVLRVRRVEERRAAQAAAEAANVAHQANQDAADRDKSAASATLPMTSTCSSFVSAFVRNSLLAADAAHAHQVADERRAEAAVQASQWTEAAQRMKGLERLRERHLAEVQQAATKAEERLLDDVATGARSTRTENEGQI